MKQEYDFAYMESWQIELLKIGAIAIVSFFLGWGSQWLRSRARKKERDAKFEEYLKKREIEKVPEKQYLQEIKEITNILLTYKERGITPEEYSIFKDKMLPQISEPKSEIVINGELVRSKEEFLRRAYGYRYRAYTVLLMTMVFQIAACEHRAFEPADFATGDTMDEKIPNMIKRIIDNGLDTTFPIRVVEEKGGEAISVITPEILDGLKQINSLLDLYQKIENDETELPSRRDIDSLFDNIKDALATLSAALEIVGSHSVIFEYRMTGAIEALKNELKQAEAEQRPVRFPPPNPDKD